MSHPLVPRHIQIRFVQGDDREWQEERDRHYKAIELSRK